MAVRTGTGGPQEVPQADDEARQRQRGGPRQRTAERPVLKNPEVWPTKTLQLEARKGKRPGESLNRPASARLSSPGPSGSPPHHLFT